MGAEIVVGDIEIDVFGIGTEIGACESAFDLALAGASITRNEVAVIAFFGRNESIGAAVMFLQIGGVRVWGRRIFVFDGFADVLTAIIAFGDHPQGDAVTAFWCV